MSIRVRRYEPGDRAAVDRLNARLEAGGVTDRVWPESESTPSESRGDPITQELHVAIDDGEVRGGVWLHEHEFMLRGEAIRAGWLKYPVAESLINREYGGVAGAMLMTMMRRQPFLMALGMGGRWTPFAQLLGALGWDIVDVPFHVAPVRSSRIARHLPHLHSKPLHDRVARLAAATGVAAVAGTPSALMRSSASAFLLRGVEVETVAAFGAWSDDVWQSARGEYGFIAHRGTALLNLLYPPEFPRLTRLRVTRHGRDIGWMCVTLPRSGAAATHEFGELRIGLLADAMGAPADAGAILAAGARFLVDSGADMLVTNQVHRAWCAPLKYLGFLQRPTNFLFAYSKKMRERLAGELAGGTVYLNRGDCDGPPR